MLIDTHCHLDAGEFAADRDAVYRHAVEAGVGMIVVPAIEAANFAATLAMRDTYPACQAALGIHPLYVERARPQDLVSLRELVERERPLAIGEIGLDLFVADPDLPRQQEYLAAQLRLARDFDLPVLLHVRRAIDLVLKQLRAAGVRRGIAHAYNGSRQQAEQFIGLGFKLGFGGAMTWPRAVRLRALAAELPLEAIVLETDSPDMAPAWLGHGARNTPGELPAIAAELATLRGIDVAQAIAATGANAAAVLGLTLAG